MKTASLALPLFLPLFPGLAHSQLSGPPITDNDYSVAINPTTGFGSSRKIAMGGAYVAIAEGVASLPDNPAGVAYRRNGSTAVWAADGSIGVYSIQGYDLDNNGNLSESHRGETLNTLGGVLQYRRWGIGAYLVSQNFIVEGSGEAQEYSFGYGFINLGYASRSREWTWGVGVRPVSLVARPAEGGSKLLELRGTSPNAGFLWHPERGPFRLGAAYNGHLKDAEILPPEGVIPRTVEGLIPPEKVVMPTVVTVGASYQFNKEAFWDFRPLLVSAQLNIVGRTPNAVGIESFLEQTIQWTGEKTTVGFHLGGEFEALPRRLRVRGGSYWEPSRYAGVPGRLHWTGGFETYLFTINFLGVHRVSFSYAGDVSTKYFTQFFGLGFWAL